MTAAYDVASFKDKFARSKFAGTLDVLNKMSELDWQEMIGSLSSRIASSNAEPEKLSAILQKLPPSAKVRKVLDAMPNVSVWFQDIEVVGSALEAFQWLEESPPELIRQEHYSTPLFM